MFQLVANPVLNIVLWVSGFFLLGMMGVIAYMVKEWAKSDYLIWVNKDGSLTITQRVIKKDERIATKVEFGDKVYSLADAHTSRGFPPWKKVYVFDEGFPVGRRLEHRKDSWYSPQTLQKIVNDVRIKMLTKEPLDEKTKMFIILGAIAGFLAALASLISLAINLGIIGK